MPIRIYEPDEPPTGLVVYFHGGGFCIGSIGLMDNVARELTFCFGRGGRVGRILARARASLPRRLRRLRSGHPLGPTRTPLASACRRSGSRLPGESAGGNLSAVVALATARRDRPAARGPGAHLSRHQRRLVQLPVTGAVRRHRDHAEARQHVHRRRTAVRPTATSMAIRSFHRYVRRRWPGSPRPSSCSVDAIRCGRRAGLHAAVAGRRAGGRALLTVSRTVS